MKIKTIIICLIIALFSFAVGSGFAFISKHTVTVIVVNSADSLGVKFVVTQPNLIIPAGLGLYFVTSEDMINAITAMQNK